MSEHYQLSLEDIEIMKRIEESPGIIAYVDECGHYGFDFEKDQNSKFFILCAIIVETSKMNKIKEQFVEIKRTSGLANTELKSSKLNDKQRKRIMDQVLALEFRIVLFIANKQEFIEETPLTQYNTVFVKYLSQRLYRLLYQAYPKLNILQDKTGYPEFQESFKRYVEANRTENNLFGEYDFDFIDSKDEVLVQLADFISGSVNKSLLNPDSINYFEMLRGKIAAFEFFPNKNEPYWGKKKPEDYKYDKRVFSLSLKSARDYISKYEIDGSEEKVAQVAMLRHLLFSVLNLDPTKYIYSDEILSVLQNVLARRITKNYLFRKIIAPMRDEGVILASCAHGYKIPISVDDIYTYLNSTTSTVGPMMNRMGICRKLIKQATNNELDVFNDEAFIRYKRYFDDLY